MGQKQAKLIPLDQRGSRRQQHVPLAPAVIKAERWYKCNNDQCPTKREPFEVGLLKAVECPYCGGNDITEVTPAADRKPRWEKKNGD